MAGPNSHKGLSDNGGGHGPLSALDLVQLCEPTPVGALCQRLPR